MRNKEEVEFARKRLAERALTPGLSDTQKMMLCGMINAIVWVAGGADAKTMDRLLSNEPMATGQDHTAAFDHLDERLRSIRARMGN